MYACICGEEPVRVLVSALLAISNDEVLMRHICRSCLAHTRIVCTLLDTSFTQPDGISEQLLHQRVRLLTKVVSQHHLNAISDDDNRNDRSAGGSDISTEIKSARWTFRPGSSLGTALDDIEEEGYISCDDASPGDEYGIKDSSAIGAKSLPSSFPWHGPSRLEPVLEAEEDAL